MKSFIIAEIASNWEGNFLKARKLIKESKIAGANAVKFQIWRANDLYTDKTVSCFDAIRGCEIQLKTLTDTIIKVKVPAGTQPGTLINCKGQGMPVHKTLNIRGNLYVKVMVLIPQLSAGDLKKIKDL